MRDALILFAERDILGDTIAWFPDAVRFAELHDFRLTCAMHPNLIRLFEPVYPNIAFVTDWDPLPPRDYAVFDLCHFDGTEAELAKIVSPYVAAHILGIPHVDEPPRVAVAPGGRPIAEPYVCIATQSTAQCKYWNKPGGWDEIVSWLKDRGYRVVCIDRHPVFGIEGTWNKIPAEAEDQTGDIPLTERARWITHAEFFIGISSGLSWLAWACRRPVVLISGFTVPHDEFFTPYRVINRGVCHGCHSDYYQPEPGNWLWCPRQQGTPRQFECSRRISVESVQAAIRAIPEFYASGR